MFNIEFSLYGAFIVISLLSVSAISIWIVGANIKYKNQEIKTTMGENSVKICKRITDANNVKTTFNIASDNWWISTIDVSKKKIILEKEAYTSSSIYSQVNAIFRTLFFITLRRNNKSFKKVNIITRTILIFLVLNFIWLAICNLLIMAGITFCGMMILFIIEEVYYKKSIRETVEEFEKIILSDISEREKDAIKRYLKYKKIIVFKKYLSSFFEPLLSLFVLYKNWGLND